MLKGLFQSLMGRARETVANNTNITYAGRERVRELNVSIEDLKTNRNRIAGEGIVAEGKLEKAIAEETKLKDATKHWKAEGDTEKTEKAYKAYTDAAASVVRLEAQVQNISERVKDLDAQIDELEADVKSVQDSLSTAATNQQYGKTLNQVESLNRDIHGGASSLNDAISASERRLSEAQASRGLRKSKDHSDILPPPTNSRAVSLDDL